MQFVAEVREQAKVYPNRQAIVQAVDVCIKKDILKEFLLENKKEVIDMVFFEYDAEAEKGSPSWTALWFLHNSYRYGSFLFGNNLISA